MSLGTCTIFARFYKYYTIVQYYFRYPFIDFTAEHEMNLSFCGWVSGCVNDLCNHHKKIKEEIGFFSFIRNI
jgi:hypothetical protein